MRTLLVFTSLLLSLSLAFPQDTGQDPSLAECVKYAAAAASPNRIFLWLGPVPYEERNRYLAMLTGHVNSLSTQTEFARCAFIDGTRGSLAVIMDYQDFGWTQKIVEQLAEADTYFHAKLILNKHYQDNAVWEGGTWPGDGKHYDAGTFTYRKEIAAETKIVPPAWLLKLCKEDINRIEGAGSKFFHGQWFFWQTAIQEDRIPGYYDFLGITDLKALEKLAGYDRKVAEAAKRQELLEAVAVSGVSRQPRRIEIEATVGISGQHGPIFRTHDFKVAKDKKNPLRLLKKSDLTQGEATEVIYSLPNGLPGSGLFSLPDGKRQNSAPDFVGFDHNTNNNDPKIHVNLSCWRGCHGPNQYLMPLREWARSLFDFPLQLKAVQPEDERELRGQYLRNMERPMDVTRKIFDSTMKEISGLDCKAYAQAVKENWAAYDAPVDSKRAARELGCSEKKMLLAFRKHLQEYGEIDTVLGAFLRGLEVPIEQWQEVYPLAQEIVLGIYTKGRK